MGARTAEIRPGRPLRSDVDSEVGTLAKDERTDTPINASELLCVLNLVFFGTQVAATIIA